MATFDVYLSGKAKWAKLKQPDPKYNKWKIDLYVEANSESHNKILDMQKQGIKNILRKDEDGYVMSFSRATERKSRDGKVQGMTPPLVLNADGSPYDGFIGNGSDVTLKLEHYTYNMGSAVRLVSVRVDKLVEFTPSRDFDEGEKEAAEGLMDQPKPNF